MLNNCEYEWNEVKLGLLQLEIHLSSLLNYLVSGYRAIQYYCNTTTNTVPYCHFLAVMSVAGWEDAPMCILSCNGRIETRSKRGAWRNPKVHRIQYGRSKANYPTTKYNHKV
jgi:hypothetical protein